MKPPKFHVGQAVVCVSPVAGLKKGTIYTVESLPFSRALGRVVIELAEFRPICGIAQTWSPERFAPVELLPDEALAQLLEETLEPVTA